LTRALSDKQDDIRVEVVLALGIIGKAGVPGLILALKDKEQDVRLNAVATIGKVGPEAREAIKPLADVLATDKSPDVRIQAANVLAKYGAEAKIALPALELAAKDKNENVSTAASDALEQIKKKIKAEK
jgi:HEAT repeat protein